MRPFLAAAELKGRADAVPSWPLETSHARLRSKTSVLVGQGPLSLRRFRER
jgi:hypothetical protein